MIYYVSMYSAVDTNMMPNLIARKSPPEGIRRTTSKHHIQRWTTTYLHVAKVPRAVVDLVASNTRVRAIARAAASVEI